MGTGIFIILCAVVSMLESRDEKNEHFIIGDCYNNFLYNQSTTSPSTLGCLPTLISTVRSSLTQVDHDILIENFARTKRSKLSHVLSRQTAFSASSADESYESSPSFSDNRKSAIFRNKSA